MQIPNQQQLEIIEAPLNARLLVSGRAGTGKTTIGIERLRYLLSIGVPASSILLLTPQRTLQEPYLELLASPERIAGGDATSATIGGLARRMCDLFWVYAAEPAGFKRPDLPPLFLTLESAQYYMAHLARPLIEEQGYFQSLSVDRNRLYSQILDNLNKSALVGFAHTEIGARLDAAWYGDPVQRRIYQDAQDCANLFRAYCLEHNLLDFSLQIEIFANVLWNQPQVRAHLTGQYRHLVYDNIEEDPPVAHDIIRAWLPDLESALLLFDTDAGYRNFLGGDPDSAYALSADCDRQIELTESFVSSQPVIHLSEALTSSIRGADYAHNEDLNEAHHFIAKHFFPEMLDDVTAQIKNLIESDGVQPSEIVVIAPYLSDALRFSITNRLEAANVPWRTHRPSRSLRDEPASKTLLVLSALAHPHWNIRPNKFDVAHTFMFGLNTDLIRAQLLAEIVYHQKDLRLSSFEEIKPETQERVTYALGARFTALRQWLEEYRAGAPQPLDYFLRRLFGEILSQPGHGFHQNIDAVNVAASLIESIQKFRYAMDPTFVNMDNPNFDLGKEYFAMLDEGVIAAQYLESWRNEDKDAVLIAPAYTYLMMNRPAQIQFWLDPGSTGWSQRLLQPLTHPFVLSRHWEAGRIWTDADEVNAEMEALAKLTGGLLARCRQKIILAFAELGETGYEGRGALLRAFQRILQVQE